MKYDRELIQSIQSTKRGVVVRKKDGRFVKTDLDPATVAPRLDDKSLVVERSSHGVIAEMLDELADSKHADGLYLVSYAQDKSVIDEDFAMYSDAIPLRDPEE